MTRKDARKRAAALWLLRKGSLSQTDIARGLGVSPQLISSWADRAGIDYKSVRARYLHVEIKKWCSRANVVANNRVEE